MNEYETEKLKKGHLLDLNTKICQKCPKNNNVVSS